MFLFSFISFINIVLIVLIVLLAIHLQMMSGTVQIRPGALEALRGLNLTPEAYTIVQFLLVHVLYDPLDRVTGPHLSIAKVLTILAHVKGTIVLIDYIYIYTDLPSQ